MNDSLCRATLSRIEEGLNRALEALEPLRSRAIDARFKEGGDPVTEADVAVNKALHSALLRDGEGWLSEETADDHSRLGNENVWIVDPIDGTREYLAGIPEWCVSIAYVHRGVAIAGGIANPATGETFLGSAATGMTYNGQKACCSTRGALAGAVVLASRSEVKRGDWERFAGRPFSVRPMGSVAYKLARVAAGLADATWTLTPKHEWDVAAGVALVEAAGGWARPPDFSRWVFNQRSPLLPGLIASGSNLKKQLIPWFKSELACAT